MTWNNPPPFIPTTPKKGKRVTPEQLASSGSEDGNQAALFCWAADMCGQYPQLKWMHSIPNGGSRHIAEATKMVAAGLRSGVWDIFLPHWGLTMTRTYRYFGLYIEMKEESKRTKKNGGLTDEQVEFGDYAKSVGYHCAVCYSWIEAREVILKYLGGAL